jgi:serine-type D-Ala-D-Ala carboxypeptidase/endopeptidase (penicillin-binding protein 4)
MCGNERIRIGVDMKRFTMIMFSILILAACSVSSESIRKKGDPGFNRMMRQIDALVHDEAFSHAHWGILIKSLDSDEVWYAHNEERLFMPASNNKIPTAAAALQVLGPEFRFTTQLLSKGEISNGVLHGDLVVWSNGDPTMYERYMEDSRAVFYDWADALKEQGIHTVNGGIIADDDAFDEEYLGSGWAWDYLQIWYAAQFGALQFNENYVDVKIVAPADKRGEITLIPNCPSSYYNLIDQITLVDTGSSRVRVDREPNTNDIVFSGNLRVGSDTLELSPTIHNPSKFYVHVLKEVLTEKGIRVKGKAVDCDELPDWKHVLPEMSYRELASYRSVPLSEVLTRLMKRSQNMYAETMPRAIAWQETGRGSIREARRIMDSVFVSFGIEPGSWIYADGSGLTRYDYISPQILVKLLEGMYHHEHGDIWLSTFPVAGVDGTLRNRMKGTAAEGNVLGKTGTISNVRGLSGYIRTAAGENVVYSFLVNGHMLSGSENERITDTILQLISEHR